MGIVGWFKKKAEEAKLAQEKARVERERRQREQSEAEERERQLEQQRLRAERQRKENILAILNEDKLPDASWALAESLPFKFQKSEHLIYVFNVVEYLEKRSSVKSLEGQLVPVFASQRVCLFGQADHEERL